MSITYNYNISKITASFFEVEGGTSTQFLKADGSLDSTVYLSQSQADSLYLQSEVNDLTDNVTWANVPDANITESSVTQHEAALSITESQISDLGSYITSVPAEYLTETEGDARYLQSFTIPAEYLTETEGDARYLQSFTEVNDLTANVTWSNVPDANITQSSVTQHEAALSITESQISDLGSYLTSIPTEYLTETEGDARYLQSFTEVNDLTTSVTWSNVPDANITESSVTQHEAALSITESQISDLQSYLTDAPSDGSLYARQDGSWTQFSVLGAQDLDDVTTLGNTTTNSITVGDIVADSLGIGVATPGEAVEGCRKRRSC
jgi:hypothetical protein